MTLVAAIECTSHVRGWCLPAQPLPSYLYAAILLIGLTILLHFVIVIVQKPSAEGAGAPPANSGANPTAAERRRGVKALFVGFDGRVSTSKLQLVLWTYAIAFAFLVALLQGGFSLVESTFSSQYLLLLGFPVAGAAGASLITSSQVATGKIDKAPVAEGTKGLGAGATEVFTDDSGNVAVGDFQYFVFNLIALGYFFAKLFRHAPDDLPVIPDTLVGLTGVAAFAYLTKKGIVNDTPALTSVTPSKAPRRATVTLRGINLVGPSSPPASEDPSRGLEVKFGGLPGTVTAVNAGDRSNMSVTAVVPTARAELHR